MTAIIIGLIFMGLGAWGLVRWFADLLVILRGLGPITILLGGLVAFAAGITAFQTRRLNSKN